MAQALSPELLNAVMQAESRGQRYDEKGRLLTSKKGAKGEMQVMDPTNVKPGFGVTPAKDNSPDERARVGRDLLAAFLNRYPDRDTALMAYNWGPGNVDKWLKAGAPESKIPEETRNYVAKIDKMLMKDTQQAKAPAPAPTPDRATLEMNKAIDSGISAQAPAPAVPAAAVVASAPSTPNVVSRTAAYGPSYQAALAVSMLGDEDEKEDKRPDEPTEAEKFLSTPTAATSLAKLDLSYTSPFAEPEPVKMNKGGIVYRADGSPEQGEVAPTQAEIEAASRPAFMTPSSGIGRKEGPISEALRSGEAYTAAARGVTEMPYNIAGAPMDIAMLARQALTGQAPAGQVGTSEFIKRKATEMGIRPAPPTDPTLRGFYTAADIGSSIVNPASIPRAAARGASAVGKTAAETMADFQQYNRQLAVPGASYAVKPKGGTFIYSPEDVELAKPVSKLANVLKDYRIQASESEASDEVRKFLNDKAPKYFTTTYGTANDPLRTAIAKKQIAPFGRDAETFNPYLNVEDTLENRLGLEKAYDMYSGIDVKAIQPENVPSFQNRMEQQMSEKMGQEGVTAEFRNLPFTYTLRKSQFETYPDLAEPFKRLLSRQDKLPENLQQALRTGEPLYDVNPYLTLLQPKNVIEALEQVPANKLKNMSFADALIKGTQELAPVRNYLTAVDLAEKGAVVPRKALDMFTSPVVKAPSVDGQWVQLDKPIATLLEGKLLKHSIGGYNAGDTYGTQYTDLPYGGKKAFDEGLVRVYSLRDDQGLPKISLEMAKSDNGKGKTWNVTQIRGRFNSEPPKETWDDIFNFLDKVDSKDGLNRIKDSLYSKSPTGESIPGNYVSWADKYDLYKKQNAK